MTTYNTTTSIGGMDAMTLWDSYVQENNRQLAEAAEQRKQREYDASALHAVWLYDDETEAREKVDAHDSFFTYGVPSTRNNEANLYVYGKDYARVMSPGDADEPFGICERFINSVDDEQRRKGYRQKFDALRTSGKDTRRSYYGLLAGMVRDEVRHDYEQKKAKHEEQVRVGRESEQRLDALLDMAMDNKAGEFTPQDVELLAATGISLNDAQQLAELYQMAKYDEAQHGVHSINEEMNLARMAYIIDKSPKLRDVLLQRVAKDAEKKRENIENAGVIDKAGSIASEVMLTLGEIPMALQGMMETTPQEKRMQFDLAMFAAQRGITIEEAQKYVEQGRMISGGLRLAREEGEAATRERLGFTGYSAAMTLADLGTFLVELSNPAMTMAWAADSVDDKTRQYEYQSPDGGKFGQAARAMAYTAGEYAGFKYAPKLAWSGVGKLFGATAGRTAAGQAVGRGIAYANRSMAGAATLAAGRGVVDVGVIIPAATGAMHAIYDFVPGTDEELDSGVEELAGLWAQMGRADYWLETAIAGAGFGAMNVPAWRKTQKLAKTDLREHYENIGVSPEALDKAEKMSAQGMSEFLRDEAKRERETNRGGMIKRAIGVAQRKLEIAEEQRARADGAVKAVLQVRGYDIMPEDGRQYRLYYGGKIKDGKAERGTESILLDEAEMNAFVEMQMDASARAAAARFRDAAATGRMVDAIRDMDIDVEWMSGALDGRRVVAAADLARQRVEERTKELAEKEGMKPEAARKKAESEVHEDVVDAETARWMMTEEGKTPTLGGIIRYGEAWRTRLEQADAKGKKAPASRANVARIRKDDGTIRRVLRVTMGATPKEIAEELGEQATLRFMENNGWNSVQAFRVLDSLRDWMVQNGGEEAAKVADGLLTLHRNEETRELYDRIVSDAFDSRDIFALTPAEEAKVKADVVEGISRLMFSDLLRDMVERSPELPEWARSLGRDLVLDLASTEAQMALAKTLSEARAEGWLPQAVQLLTGKGTKDALRLIAEGKEAVEAALRGKAEPEPGEYLDTLFRMQRTQDELDARLGRDVAVAPEAFDAFEAEARTGQAKLEAEEEARRKEEDTDAAEDLAETEEENPGISHDEAVKKTADKKNARRQEDIESSPTATSDADFVGGICQEMVDPEGSSACKLGFLSIDRLSVLPNFKIGAAEETGVVEPLSGDYRADHDPIRVWRKSNGELVVISGRHRLDAAKRAGMDKIISYLYDESEMRNLLWARRFDIESNIRDNQATALETALYIRGEWSGGRVLTEEEITRAGIARRGKAGAIGYEIATKGADEVMDAWRNGALTEQQAFWIASFMPGNAKAQRAGVSMAMSGEVTKGEILTAMETAAALEQMQKSLGITQQTDLFGNAIDDDGFLNFVAKYIVRKRNEIGKDLAYIGATATKRNAAAMGKKYGVDVKDPEAMKKKRDELAALQQRWKTPYTDTELMEEIRDAYDAYRKENGLVDVSAPTDEPVEGSEQPVDIPGQGTFLAREGVPINKIWNREIERLRQGGEVHYSTIDENALKPNQSKIKNKAIVTFEDGVKRNEKALVLRKDGDSVWGHVPSIPQLENAGFGEADIYMEVGNASYGYLHFIMRHGLEFAEYYPNKPLHEAAQLFLDETLNSIERLHIEKPYKESRNASNKVVADSKNIRVGQKERKRLIVLNFKKKQNRYLFMTSYEHDEDIDKFKKGEGSVTITEDGLTLRLLTPLRGEVTGLEQVPHTPPQELSSDTRRLSTENHITESSPVNAESLKFDFLRKVKHPENMELHLSIFGMSAKDAERADAEGLTFIDPADQKKKFVVSDADAMLRTNFTLGQLNVPIGGHKDTSLGSLLDFPALFSNYPELADVRVRFYTPRKSDGCSGFFCPVTEDGSRPYIAINMSHTRTPGRILRTLLHESQHWIQSREGHAGGAGSFGIESALGYLNKALEARLEDKERDDWSRANEAFLRSMIELVGQGDATALDMVYFYSHGEQEARFTGDQLGVSGGVPLLGGYEGEKPSYYTISVLREASELGGVTFGGMGRFAYLLEKQLLPAGEFSHDRQIMQMKETVSRMMTQLHKLPQGKAEGLSLASDGLNVIERLTSLLPDSYRMALEPYRLYFTYYATLHGTGNAEYASRVIPMEGWDVRMHGAMHNMAMRLLEDGVVSKGDMEYWDAHPTLAREIFAMADAAREDWERAMEAAKEEIPDRVGAGERDLKKARREHAMSIFSQEHPQFFEDVFKAFGQIRADKLMDKFLQRVSLQLDHYRKDKTLGKIRRVVDSVQVLPKSDGKPRKGMMDADSYRHLQELVSLMEMTKSEFEDFKELYDGEHEGKRLWDELAEDELVNVEVYDSDGNLKEISVTRQEFDVYASFEHMTAAQAEAAARSLGEFITTGRQAWQNVEEANKARTMELCAPLLGNFKPSENMRRQRKLEQQRAFGQNIMSCLMNDAQFFALLENTPEISGFAHDFGRRIADGHANIEAWEKERTSFAWDAILRASGSKNDKEARVWLDEVNRTKKSGVRLVAQPPDFEGKASADIRQSFLKLLSRKTRQKNFSPNKFAAALKFMESMSDERMPSDLKDEVMRKYGRIGNAKSSRLQGADALGSLLSAQEWEKFSNIGKTIKDRAKKAKDKWEEENSPKDEAGWVATHDKISAAQEELELSQREAAYRVLLCEQADYAEMMHAQGYTEEVVDQLRTFAGQDVMRLAYELRDKLGERTPQIKELYERMFGIPFPAVENYFRAYFDAGHEAREKSLMSNEGVGNAAGGGKVKVLYTRRKHNAKVDPTMDIINAFESAMREQDTLLAWGTLSKDMRRVLNHRYAGRSMRDALTEKLGNGTVSEMERWADMFDRLTIQHEEFGQGLGKFARAWSSASAELVLNGRVGSLMKQATALFNTIAGSDYITPSEWLNSMMRRTRFRGIISMEEMMQRPELAGRFKGWSAGMNKKAALQMSDNVSAHGATAPWTRSGMAAMEWLDMRANAKSCCILYDAVYRKMKKQRPEMTHEELDTAAMGEVRRSLTLKAQPMDFRSRSMLATKSSIWATGALFLGGESINTFGDLYYLWKKDGGVLKGWGKGGGKRQAAAVWLTQGIMLQMATALFNWMTDDAEQWERRDARQYFTGAAFGPVMGVPFVSQIVSLGASGVSPWLPKWAKPWAPTQSLLPMGDLSRSFAEVNRAFFGKKQSSWQDKSIALENALRALLVVPAVMLRNPQAAGNAKMKAAVYGTAFVSNVLDFLLRLERAVEERLLE